MKKVIDIIKAVCSLIALLVVVLSIPACTEVQTKYVQIELTRDPRPVIDKIKNKDVECLSVPVHNKLYNEIITLENYAVYLETIIDNTKKVK